MTDFITCDLSELTEDALMGISDTDLAVLVGRFKGWSIKRESSEFAGHEIYHEYYFIRPDGSPLLAGVSDEFVESEFCSILRMYVNELEYALELFAKYKDFKLENIKTSGGCFLWKASVPTLPGFECREFDIDPARVVAKLYVREKISVPRLKMWLEERGLLDVNHKTE